MATTPEESRTRLRWSEQAPSVASCLTRAELLALPVFVSLRTAARALGLGRSTAYELARKGVFPCRVVKVGHAYRVPGEELRRLAGVERPQQSGADRTCATDIRLPQPTGSTGGTGRCPACYTRLHRRRGAEHVHP
jgi:excisionase family DNA binding protein